MNNFIYLDLNVFDQIEKIQKLTPEQAEPYQMIQNLIRSGTLSTVYSSAHISDLVRGYNPSDDTTKLNGHLQHLSDLTNNRYMCLYGQKVDVTIDTKDVFEMFNSSLEDSRLPEPTSFSGLISSIANDEDAALANSMLQTVAESMTTILTQAFPEDMMKAFDFPIYQKMFPKTYISRDLSTIMDDILTLDRRMSQDPEMYRDLKRIMNPGNISEFMKIMPPGQTLNKKELKATLKDYDIESMVEKYAPKTKTSDNEWFDKITNLYSQIDFKGFNTDKEFDNMIDDSNHTFYGAHCSFFITKDTRCHYKAKEVYKALGLGSLVFTPDEFLEYYKSLQTNDDGTSEPLP